jgi:hypothetical protein
MLFSLSSVSSASECIFLSCKKGRESLDCADVCTTGGGGMKGSSREVADRDHACLLGLHLHLACWYAAVCTSSKM